KGMPLGFYYSIMDWHHPDYLPRRPWETDRPEAGADLNRYIDYMKNQLQELIEKYDPTMIWFDGEWEHTVEEMRSAEVEKMLLSLKPKLLINDRLFRRAPGHGDFGTPENYVPATGVENTDGAPALWEACYTMNYNSWGYNHYEIEFHTQTQLIRQLIEIVSKGGNLLLNVGPTPEGTLQPEFVARLKALGKWLKVNGEAIYGTTASCFNKLPFFGRCTVKEHRIYVHVMGWPTNRQIELPGLQTPVTEVALLAQPDQHLRFQQTKNSVMVDLPERAPDRDATVIIVHLKSSPRVIPYEIKPQADQSIQLPIYLADIQSQMGQRAFLEQYYRVTLLTNWQNVNDFPVWEFTTERPAKYEVQISYACGWGEKGSQFVVKVDNYEIPGVAETSGSEFFPATFALGTVTLPTGKHRLECRIKSVVNNSALRLEKINLVPLSH
ncbi:alpha-L-fucosidase, partial [candidate division KSB1 bacterium]|nr:alpha-L-fucosidase [candidate division KSB1 bacterium]